MDSKTRTPDTIRGRTLSGIVALSSRTFFLQLIAFSATFLLTIFLSPAVFGIFYVVSAIIAFLGYFSDIGLAAALIQKKESLTREDITTTFTIQQILVGGAVVCALLLTPVIGTWYGLDSPGIGLYQALVFAFFLSSLKTIPSILLERDLAFGKLVIPQILETVGFYVTAVTLAWFGFGVTSFTWAVIVRSVIGLIAMYIVKPWMPGIGISRSVALRLLRFGIPFQMNSFLALVKDDLLTVYLGKVLPLAHIGYIGWAKKWAEVPLRLIMDSIVRVTFPAFSRLQHDEKRLREGIEHTLFGLSVTIFPITVAMIVGIGPLMGLIPQYGKWEPALLSFYLFALASVVSGLSTPLTNALNALGHIQTTLKLMILWTCLTWVLTLLLLPVFGYNGVAMALLSITSTVAVVVILVKKVVPFSFFRNIRAPLVAAIVQFVVATITGTILGSGTLGLSVSLGLGAILFISVIVGLERNKIRFLTSQLSLLWKR
ncbi:oligosaccharide flippase family protein [Candidatus Gottesmanbacteria bacterium]|nr:oligosaccharide flippase family protein [Candidatus Gottesmanbacteria bacterium]